MTSCDYAFVDGMFVCSDKSKVVADFGCGDAKIARSVPNAVHSFDLVALNSHVIACDIKRVCNLIDLYVRRPEICALH